MVQPVKRTTTWRDEFYSLERRVLQSEKSAIV